MRLAPNTTETFDMTPFLFLICTLPFVLLAFTFAPFMRKTARLQDFRFACLLIGCACVLLVLFSTAVEAGYGAIMRDGGLLAAGVFIMTLAGAPLGRAGLRLAGAKPRETRTYREGITNTVEDGVLGFPMLAVIASVDHHLLHTGFIFTAIAITACLVAYAYLWASDSVDIDDAQGSAFLA